MMVISVAQRHLRRSVSGADGKTAGSVGEPRLLVFLLVHTRCFVVKVMRKARPRDAVTCRRPGLSSDAREE
jgi:hypothetical protein